MNFLADGMLGKLTRWLRMLGHDVTYSAKLNDAELLEIAKKENRILLTRDLELYQRAIPRGIYASYVQGKTESEMLAELAKRYSFVLVVDMEKSRCPACNFKLASAKKEELLGKLENNTLTYYEKFWRCPNCGKIYWQGAHWKQIMSTLNESQTKLKKEERN